MSLFNFIFIPLIRFHLMPNSKKLQESFYKTLYTVRKNCLIKLYVFKSASLIITVVLARVIRILNFDTGLVRISLKFLEVDWVY